MMKNGFPHRVFRCRNFHGLIFHGIFFSSASHFVAIVICEERGNFKRSSRAVLIHSHAFHALVFSGRVGRMRPTFPRLSRDIVMRCFQQRASHDQNWFRELPTANLNNRYLYRDLNIEWVFIKRQFNISHGLNQKLFKHTDSLFERNAMLCMNSSEKFPHLQVKLKQCLNRYSLKTIFRRSFKRSNDAWNILQGSERSN